MKDVRKILVFKLCCFGDVVFITPAIKSLKLNFPDAEISLISSSWIKSLYPLIEDADRLIVYDPPPDSDNIFRKIKSAVSLIKLLRNEKFDLVFLGHRNNKFGIILRLTGIRYRLGFSETKYINVAAPFRHEINENARYLEILSANGLKTAPPVSVLKRNYNREELKNTLGLHNFENIVGLFPFGGVNPGTKMAIKRWDTGRYLELAGKLSAMRNTGVVLFEGKENEEKFSEESKIPDNCFVKKIDFGIIPACDVFVSADTGPLHIAAALGIPTVGLFGPSDPLLVAPRDNGGKNVFINKVLPCSPCYTPSTAIDRKNREYWKDDNFICKIGTNECMKSITTDEVYKEIISIINISK